MSANAARKIELPSAEELAGAPGLAATDEFVATRALEILREWMSEAEIGGLDEEAERVVTADGARG